MVCSNITSNFLVGGVNYFLKSFLIIQILYNWWKKQNKYMTELKDKPLPLISPKLEQNKKTNVARVTRKSDDILQPGYECYVNFTYILRAVFCTKFLCAAFLYLHFRFVLFGARILAQKLLLKCWWNWHQYGMRSREEANWIRRQGTNGRGEYLVRSVKVWSLFPPGFNVTNIFWAAFAPIFLHKKFILNNVSTIKLRVKLSYEIAARKMLVKLTTGLPLILLIHTYMLKRDKHCNLELLITIG
jgi:hypothetical protein